MSIPQSQPQYPPPQPLQQPSPEGFDILKIGVTFLIIGSLVLGAGILTLAFVTEDITIGNIRTIGDYPNQEVKMDITLPGFSVALALLGVAVMINGIGTALTMYGLRKR